MESIKEFYNEVDTSIVNSEEDEDFEAPEGRTLTAVHRRRERSKILIQKKKGRVISKYVKLECEACGFDFTFLYGELGTGFIECHHDVPVSSLSSESKTSINDLRLVCSNCHSMIHKRKPWLTISELKDIIGIKKGLYPRTVLRTE